MLYAAIAIAFINVVAVAVIARLGRRLSTTEERPEIGRLEPVAERAEHALDPHSLIG
jgi:uncharacterized MAPEG superfamily protein